MLPLVFAGAAAIFLTGCYAVFPSHKDVFKDNLRLPKGRQNAEDGTAIGVYHDLIDRGVRDADLDQGCRVVDFGAPGPNSSRLGKGDGEVWPCESYSYAIDRYETYRDIVEGIGQGPVPWTLDDRDPATGFDRDLRDRVRQVRRRFGEETGLDPASAEYQEKLALALFYLTLFPRDAATIRENRTYLTKLTEELSKVGLEYFRRDLLQNGGFGAVGWETEFEFERSALEAYSRSKGKCTEKSKLLFAVLREAGLRPFFIRTDYLQMKHRIQGRVEVPAYMDLPFMSAWKGSHVYVGVALPEGRVRHLDPMFGLSRPDYLQYYPIDLSHALAMDLSNRGVYYFQGGYQAKAERLIRQSFALAPHDPMIGRNFDMILLEEGLRNFF